MQLVPTLNADAKALYRSGWPCGLCLRSASRSQVRAVMILGAFMLLALVAPMLGLGVGPVAASAPVAMLSQDNNDVALPSVEVKAIHFNLIRQNRIEAAISVDLVLLLNNPADVEDIHARLPQIRADFLQGLLALAKVRFRLDQPIDVDLVRRYLEPIATKRLGEKRVQIFVENAVITPHKN